MLLRQGSRGIANIAAITKAAVDEVKSQGALPFIIPAMGSHGGATAEGQREVLEHYGITEETMEPHHLNHGRGIDTKRGQRL